MAWQRLYFTLRESVMYSFSDGSTEDSSLFWDCEPDMLLVKGFALAAVHSAFGEDAVYMNSPCGNSYASSDGGGYILAPVHMMRTSYGGSETEITFPLEPGKYRITMVDGCLLTLQHFVEGCWSFKFQFLSFLQRADLEWVDDKPADRSGVDRHLGPKLMELRQRYLETYDYRVAVTPPPGTSIQILNATAPKPNFKRRLRQSFRSRRGGK